MKKLLFAILLVSSAPGLQAAIVEFDLSPPGHSPGVGLSPANEVIPGFSAGSGNEIGRGIFFDTSTMLLTLNLGYGSAAGFTDLTTPAFAWLFHGPAPLGETAPVLFDLAAFHTFAPDPTHGGRIVGTLAFNSDQAAGLLAGLDYINIYTPANFGGELRGQLVVVPEPGAGALLLGGGLIALLWRTAKHRRLVTRR